MNVLEKYQLYISSACPSCDNVLRKLQEHKIDISTVNIDTESNQLPFKLMVIPALVKENKLISYGCNDIIASLSNF